MCLNRPPTKCPTNDHGGWDGPPVGATKPQRRIQGPLHRVVQGPARQAVLRWHVLEQEEANKAWQNAEANLAAGRIGDQRRGKQQLRRYVLDEWFSNHLLEATTRQTYTYLLDRYILPSALGDMRMVEILPSHVREWVNAMERNGANPPTVRYCKIIVDAIFTTRAERPDHVPARGQGCEDTASPEKATAHHHRRAVRRDLRRVR